MDIQPSQAHLSCRVFLLGTMGFPLAKTPASVKIRILGYEGYYYIMRRVGERWESIATYRTKDKALARLEIELNLD